MNQPIVSTESGKFRGTIGKDINGNEFYAFRGIPYAKPIVGASRFKLSEPIEPWTGVREATFEGDACYARHMLEQHIIGSEDCLSLNVYTPKMSSDGDTVKKPVMVWIHGGGFRSGSSSSDLYGPEFLVAEDVILVTINYRLHILGFLMLEDPSLEVPGNAGLKDMVLALKWVQKNIGGFGGDPKNVTIFGESAGGAAVHYLILSPLAEGLFHKAILQSGCALNPWASGTSHIVELGKYLGLTTTNEKELLEHFRKISVTELFKAVEKLFNDNDEFRRAYRPTVEKEPENAVLPKEPIDIIKSGKYNHVPILIGYTNREGIISYVSEKKSHYDFERLIRHTYNIKGESNIAKIMAEKIKAFYYGDEEPSRNNKDTLLMLYSDVHFIVGILNSIILHSQNAQQPIYLYRMSIESELNMFKRHIKMNEPGVSHADDIGYLFKNITTPEKIRAGSVEDVGRRRFCKIWSNFARYGHPNPTPDDLINVEWKPITTDQLYYVDIGKELTTGVNPEQERFEFWNEIAKMCIE